MREFLNPRADLNGASDPNGAICRLDPAALFFALDGNWGKAVILVVWGLVVVGTIDNLLYPILVGNRLKLRAVLAFIAVVGCLILFGPAGLILGPVTLTVIMVFLEIWTERTMGRGKNSSP